MPPPRSTWLLKTIAGAGRPCLFVGDSGTAKSVTVAAFLAGLDAAAFTSCALGFSSRTSSADVQRAIEDCVEKRTKASGRVIWVVLGQSSTRAVRRGASRAGLQPFKHP
jgi:hypothetical protein